MTTFIPDWALNDSVRFARYRFLLREITQLFPDPVKRILPTRPRRTAMAGLQLVISGHRLGNFAMTFQGMRLISSAVYTEYLKWFNRRYPHPIVILKATAVPYGVETRLVRHLEEHFGTITIPWNAYLSLPPLAIAQNELVAFVIYGSTPLEKIPAAAMALWNKPGVSKFLLHVTDNWAERPVKLVVFDRFTKFFNITAYLEIFIGRKGTTTLWQSRYRNDGSPSIDAVSLGGTPQTHMEDLIHRMVKQLPDKW